MFTTLVSRFERSATIGFSIRRRFLVPTQATARPTPTSLPMQRQPLDLIVRSLENLPFYDEALYERTQAELRSLPPNDLSKIVARLPELTSAPSTAVYARGRLLANLALHSVHIQNPRLAQAVHEQARRGGVAKAVSILGRVSAAKFRERFLQNAFRQAGFLECIRTIKADTAHGRKEIQRILTAYEKQPISDLSGLDVSSLWTLSKRALKPKHQTRIDALRERWRAVSCHWAQRDLAHWESERPIRSEQS